MTKLSAFILALLITSFPLMAHTSLSADDDDTRYLTRAVPEVDGKVVFSKEYQIPGMTQEAIYTHLMKWMDKRLKENKNAHSRVVFSDEKEGTIAGVGEEWMVFKSTALSLDRTQINYQLTASCEPEKCLLKIEKIRFTYQEKEKYTAEEWITDQYALNKAKTKLVRGLAKWRKKTVDFTDNLFKEVTVALGESLQQLEAPEKKEKQTARQEGPIVIQVTPQKVQATAVATMPEIGKESAEMPGYTEVDLKQIPGEIFALMGSSKLVISIGQDQFNRTTMTANAGGAIGYQSGKAVAYCSLSPEQPTEAIEKAETYTLLLFAPEMNQPKVIIECRKFAAQAPQTGQAKTYVGEIIKLLIKR